MKKNILAIVILAATLINLTLTAVSLFIVMPSMTKTNNLVTKVVSMLDLEIQDQPLKSDEVALADRDSNPLDEQTVPLKKVVGDKKNHAAMYKIVISLNKKADDFSTVKEQLTSNIDIVFGRIADIIGAYTIDNVLDNKKTILDEVKLDLEEFFDTKAIYDVTFSRFIAE